MREYDTGATRDDDATKIDPEGVLQPIVLLRFCEYMRKHQDTALGRRDSDNWQGLFGPESKTICLKSLLRHTLDLWLIHRGHAPLARDSAQEALCAILFNASTYLYELLLEEMHDNNM